MPKFVIAFLVFLVGGLFATLVIDVSWGISVYLLNYFLNPISRWWYHYLPDLRYSFIIAIVILTAFLIAYNQYTHTRLFAVPQSKWLIMDVLLFSVISLWAVWPAVHNPSLINHYKLLGFIYISYKVVDNSEKFERMIWSFLVGAFYLGWVGHNQGRSFGNRMENFGPSDCGGDGNSIALILIAAIPLLIYYLLRGKKWQKFLSLLFMAYIMDAVILVNSRGAFLGLISSMAYFFYYLFFNKGTTFAQKRNVILVIIAGFGLFIYLTDAAFWERMFSIQTEIETGSGGGGRTFFWAKGIELSKEYPLGLGTWGYQYLSPQFIPENYLTGGRRAVHSLYVQCLVERGYLGALIFTALLASNFLFVRKIKRYLNEKRQHDLSFQIVAIESGLIAFLAGAVFLNRLQAEVLYIFMMFIACFGSIYYIKKKT